MLIITIIIKNLKNTKKECFSVVSVISRSINTRNYWINRANLISTQLPDVFLIWAFLIILISIMQLLDGSILFNYIAFIALPLCLNFWIYFTTKAQVQQDDTIIIIRRIITYVGIAGFITYDYYMKYLKIVSADYVVESEIVNFFLLSGSVIFIAIERMLKVVTDDYKSYYKKDSEGQDMRV